DDISETIGERIMALSEMFPDSVRNVASATGGYTVSGAKWLYNFTGKTIWILSTSFMILALPVVFEVERVQTEEAQLQQQRQILLGPSAASGGGGIGGVPPGYPAGAR
ncbi:predicted protein, partial [Nematostella vectensis]